MLSSKSHGFITEVELTLPRPKPKIPDEDVVKALAQDYSSYVLSTSLRSPPPIRDLSKDQVLNSLVSQIARKRQYLSLLSDTLAILLRESQGSESLTNISTRLSSSQAKLYPLHSASILTLTEQYEFVLLRSESSVNVYKSQTSILKREVDSLSSMAAQAKEQQMNIMADTKLQEAQLRVMKEHLEAIRGKREKCRMERLESLKGYHGEVDEEWKNAKIDKGKSMIVQRSIEKLRGWLARQREMRKVLRLHIGLEQLARSRFNRLVTRIVRSLGGSSVEDALANFQTAIARNKSLLQEAEYKLSLQSSYELKMTVLRTELQHVSDTLFRASFKDYRQKLEKSEIQYSTAVARMKTAEKTFKRAVSIKEGIKLSATEAITQLDSICSLLTNLDPISESAPPISVSFQGSGIAKGFLLLEKRLLFVLTVASQRSQAARKTPGSVESLIKLLQTSPRMRSNYSVPDFSLTGLNFTQVTTRETEELSSSKDSTIQKTASAKRSLKARKSHREKSLNAIYLSRVTSTPQEYFAARMQLFKDFEAVKSAQEKRKSARKVPRTSEVMYSAKQGEKRMASIVFSMVEKERSSLSTRKSGVSEQTDKRKSVRTLTRTHTSTQSEALLKSPLF